MVNVAIVGYGFSGRSFMSYLVPFAQGMNLYAISTRNPERRALADQEHPGIKIYASVDELLADDKVDLVICATPHYTHKDLAIQAMSAGKHVIVDKVMCMNATEAEEMIAARDRNNVVLSVFHERRWDWDYMTVKKVIDEGLIGIPYLFQVAILGTRPPRSWRGVKAQSGGVLYDWGAHLLDQALQLVDAPVQSVYCDIKYLAGSPTDGGNYGHVILRFANDVTYEVELGNQCAIEKPRWLVMGDKGGLIKYGLDPQEPFLKEGRIEDTFEAPEDRAKLVTLVDGVRKEQIIETVRGDWLVYFQNIADVINHEAELFVKPEEMLTLMRIYDAAMQSSETGQAVEP